MPRFDRLATGPADPDYSLPGPARRLRSGIRERGLLLTVSRSASWAALFAAGPRVGSRLRGSGTFRFQGLQYGYLDRWHGWTWLNERSVEVPLGAAAIERGGGEVLEVGNVLGHYLTVSHRVVDKYEESPGVENADLFEIDEPDSFDLVVSLSTLEHVGWDEPVRDPERAIAAVEHLKALVAPGGLLFVTVPVGYHPRLDRAAVTGELGFSSVSALSRGSLVGPWVEADPRAVIDSAYDELLYCASAVLVCEWRRS